MDNLHGIISVIFFVVQIFLFNFSNLITREQHIELFVSSVLFILIFSNFGVIENAFIIAIMYKIWYLLTKMLSNRSSSINVKKINSDGEEETKRYINIVDKNNEKSELNYNILFTEN